jgi:hypothetical protein
MAAALERLNDESTRAKIAGGDVSPIDDLNLTDEERALVEAAASDYPEVVGLGFSSNPFSFTFEKWDSKLNPLPPPQSPPPAP